MKNNTIENGIKKAKNFIKTDYIKDKPIYIYSSSLYADSFTKGFCSVLEKENISYNISILFFTKEVINGEVIYPSNRQYAEPKEDKDYQYLFFNFLHPKKHYKEKSSHSISFYSNEYSEYNKTPDFLKERRNKYLG